MITQELDPITIPSSGPFSRSSDSWRRHDRVFFCSTAFFRPFFSIYRAISIACFLPIGEIEFVHIIASHRQPAKLEIRWRKEKHSLGPVLILVALLAEYKGREVPEDKREELGAKAREATAQIRRAADVGAFLMSDEAVARLNKLKQDEEEISESGGSWSDYLDRDWVAVNTCLGDIINIAKTDLKIRETDGVIRAWLQKLGTRIGIGKA